MDEREERKGSGGEGGKIRKGRGNMEGDAPFLNAKHATGDRVSCVSLGCWLLHCRRRRE